MSKPTKILLLTVATNVILAYILAYSKHYIGTPNSTASDYFIIPLLTIFIVIVPAFIVGFLGWLIFKRIRPGTTFYYILFNLLGVVLLVFANLKIVYSNWCYNKYQANIDYNESLTKQGRYLDTCMMLVQDDIKKACVIGERFRILSYNYDETIQCCDTLPAVLRGF